MRGESFSELFAGVDGFRGDRLYAIGNAAAPATFPYLTGREQPSMLLYRAVFDNPAVRVTTPSGEVLAVDDARLLALLGKGIATSDLSLLHSPKGMPDCAPISLCSLATVCQLGEDLSMNLDFRRFRANIYADMGEAFAEEQFVGRTLHIGEQVRIAVTERDQRCKMITLDPETGVAEPAVMKYIAQARQSRVGVYCAVLAEGMVRVGDTIRVG